MKNCLTCALASDHGDTLKCRFKPGKLLEQFPFYPVFSVRARTMPVHKNKIPDRDCPAWKTKKASVGPGGTHGTLAAAVADGARDIEIQADAKETPWTAPPKKSRKAKGPKK